MRAAPAVARIAFIDSGIDDVPDLRACRDPGIAVRLSTGRRVVFGPDGPDRLGHGTLCARVAHLLAPSARLVPVQVFDQTLETYSELVIEGLLWALEQGFPIINLSLALPPARLAGLAQILDAAPRRALVVVPVQPNAERNEPISRSNLALVEEDPALDEQTVIPPVSGRPPLYRASGRPPPGIPGPAGHSLAAARVSGWLSLRSERQPPILRAAR